jgi:type IV pilus assembly protein PilP
VSRLACVLLAALLATGPGCGGGDVVSAPGSAAPAGSGASKPAGSGSARAAVGAKDAGAPEPDAAPFVVEFSENDFVESESSRDPYRNFAALFLTQAKARTVLQRKVRAGQFALDELKLSGIITRGDSRALVTDPGGLGWVLHSGDYVGKAELVSTGGPTGVDVALNWRVDRIRDTDVVFLREDPAHPEIAPSTRVMYLHPVEDEAEPASAKKR